MKINKEINILVVFEYIVQKFGQSLNITSSIFPLFITSSCLLFGQFNVWFCRLRSFERQEVGRNKDPKTSSESCGSFSCNFAASRGKKRFLSLDSLLFYSTLLLDLIYKFICITWILTIVVFSHDGLSIFCVSLINFQAINIYKISYLWCNYHFVY